MKLLVQGKKLCFDISVEKEKCVFRFVQKVSSDCLKLLVSKELISLVFLTQLMKTSGEIV